MNRSKGHPLTVCVGNTSVEYQRKKEGCKLLALLPIIMPRKGGGGGGGMRTPAFKERKAQVLQVAYGVALEQLKKATSE
ncbi:hypothetical protein OEZ86_004335 [Tetradesmus obliquus]|nr:hypothetical protein OEZ86_004335 [Tetradesmus obliquus]